MSATVIKLNPRTGDGSSTRDSASRPGAQRDRDSEFLPAVLEVIETAPSPIALALIRTIAAMLIVALAWATFGFIDVIATAQGKIQPPGRVKVVQAVDGGRVAKIHVSNGTAVEAGDVLIELEPSEAEADVRTITASIDSLHGEIARRQLAIAMLPKLSNASAEIKLPVDLAISSEVRGREERLLQSDFANLQAQLAQLDAQYEVKLQEREKLTELVKSQNALVSSLDERVGMRSELARSGAGSRAQLLEMQQTYLAQSTSLVNHRGQLSEIEATLKLVTKEREKLIQGFSTDSTQKWTEAERSLVELEQRLKKAQVRLNNMVVRSPTAGLVQAQTVFSVGQVIGSGHEILRVVPTLGKLEVEAYLPNKDIGFVTVGQEVTIKLDAFPFTRYGHISGRLAHIAKDAIPQQDAALQEGSPAAQLEAKSLAGAQRVQNLVYPVIVSFAENELRANGQVLSIVPGMSVTIEIKTGQRRVIDYVLSPLTEVTATAMKER